jgi:hypothetical protein
MYLGKKGVKKGYSIIVCVWVRRELKRNIQAHTKME